MISGKRIQSLQNDIGILDPLPCVFLDMDMSFTSIFTNIDTYNYGKKKFRIDIAFWVLLLNYRRALFSLAKDVFLKGINKEALKHHTYTSCYRGCHIDILGWATIFVPKVHTKSHLMFVDCAFDLNCKWQIKKKNPPDKADFCKAWSEDFLCQFWKRLEKGRVIKNILTNP